MRIGIDIGGTAAKLGLVDDGGTILRRAQVPTGRQRPAGELVAGVASAARELLAAGDAEGIGVAAPGFRRPDGEGVVNVGNLPLIDGYPLRQAIQDATDLPVALDNDANAAALGEARYGAGQASTRLLVVTVGTGIGAGMVVDGAIHRVCWEGLGDPGHVIVKARGPECACGGHGCVEALASVPAILDRAAELAGPGPVYGTFAAVVKAARAGGCPQGAASSQALTEAGHYLGQALATLVHLLGPDTILLGGGGIDAAEDLLTAPAEEALFAHVQRFFRRDLVLGRAALGNDAGVIGAAAL